MQTATSLQLYTLPYRDIRTYLVAAVFIAGNLLLPQLVHLIPNGGHIWLPIYLFTLVAAYKYGWKAGLLTAVASPLLNSILFGMPAQEALPAILLKSVMLAGAAGWAAYRFRKATLLLLAAVVLSYQTVGTLGEWALCGSLTSALNDFLVGFPGMLLQVFGGWILINRLLH